MHDDVIEAKLEAYIDGELSPQEMAQVNRLLASSWRYRHVVEQMQLARRWMSTLPRASAPAGLLEAIDPSLERAALFDEPITEPRWRMIVSPQALALAATVVLAATLVAAMFWLVPQMEQGGTIATDEQASPVPPQVAQNAGPEEQKVEQPQQDAVQMPESPIVDRGEGDPTMPDEAQPVAPERNDANVLPVTPGLPQGVSDAVLVSARVPDVSQASVEVSHFLAQANQPLDARELPATALPEAVRQRLGLAEAATVQVFVASELSLEQIGQLASQLATAGDARAIAPPSFVATHKPAAAPAQAEPEDQQRIYGEDVLQVLIQRSDQPQEDSESVPQIGRSQVVDVEVSTDGYIDLGKIGLGRIDVLGRKAPEVAAEVSAALRRDYQIEADVQMAIAARVTPQAGRDAMLINLDREPLKTGDIVQVELPDGAWLHAVVDEEGTLDADELGKVKAAGRSTVQIQEELREMAVARASAEAQEQGGLLTTDRAPRPTRVINITARRAQGVDAYAAAKADCLIVIIPAAEDSAGKTEPAPADDGDAEQEPASEQAGD